MKRFSWKQNYIVIAGLMALSMVVLVTDPQSSDQTVLPQIDKENLAPTVRSVNKIIPVITQKETKANSLKTETIQENTELSVLDPASDVIVINYAEDMDYYDESTADEWEEQAYIDHQQSIMDSMTEEELATKQRIASLESQLMRHRDDRVENEAVNQKIEALFTPEDEQQNTPLIDLRCSKTLCRIALNFADKNAQSDAIYDLTDEMEGWQQSAVEVTVNADDSRILTVYLESLDGMDTISENLI